MDGMLVACFSFVDLLGRSNDFYHVVLADVKLPARAVRTLVTIISRLYFKRQN